MTSSLPEDVETAEKLEKVENIETTQEQEQRDQGIQETVLSAEVMHENVIHDGGNQTSDEAGLIEQPSLRRLPEALLQVSASSV